MTRCDTYYKYNDRGELSSIVQPNGEKFIYTYYKEGLLKTKEIPGGGTTTYTYNPKNQLKTSTDGNGNLLEFIWKNLQLLATYSTACGLYCVI